MYFSFHLAYGAYRPCIVNRGISILYTFDRVIASILKAVFTFREKQNKKKGIPIHLDKTKNAALDDRNDHENRWLYCRQCRQKITKPNARISINGSHKHTFANPSGIVFEIGCFSQVRGCSGFGSPSTEFAWFPGSSWQIAVCSKCLTHLGWYFTPGDRPGFTGLILDRLAEGTSKHA